MKRGRLKKAVKAYADKDAIVTQELLKVLAPTVKPSEPFSFRVTVHEQTRLQPGDVIMFDGVEQVVVSVRPSCARIQPLGSLGTKKVTFTPRFSEKPVEFNAPVSPTVSAISANSECEILRRLGRNWR